MYCPNCRHALPDDYRMCPFCGVTLSDGSLAPKDPLSPQPILPYGNPPTRLQSQYAFPMKWFKFLIYFSLFAGAALNLMTAFLMIFSRVTFVAYDEYPDLYTLDRIYGCLLLGLSALSVITRFRLAGFFRDGPILLAVLYGGAAILTLAYNIVFTVMTDAPLSDAFSFDAIYSLLISGVMLGLNSVYFWKRRSLFTR